MDNITLSSALLKMPVYIHEDKVRQLNGFINYLRKQNNALTEDNERLNRRLSELHYREFKNNTIKQIGLPYTPT